MAYLLAGVLHAACDLDVTNPAGKSVIVSVADGKTGHSDQKGLGEHHCHGCFSVAVPQPVLSVAAIELAVAPNWLLPAAVVGVGPETDSPPPIFLA